MVSGAPKEARWLRAEPRRELPAGLLERMVPSALPRCRVIDVQPLADGLHNANFKLQLDSCPEPIVLRIYEHDPSLCQKEIDLMELVRGAAPAPEVIHAEPRGWEDMPPFVLMRYVEGISFRELKRGGDTQAIAQAAQSIGEALAAIGRITFSRPGGLGPGPNVTEPLLEGADAAARFLDLCLASRNLRRRMPSEVCDRIQTFVRGWAPELAQLDDEACLVHGDFGKRNLRVRCVAGQWKVAAVLDWESAICGSPLADAGHFLRYERASRALAEPHFSEGYLRGGGKLPEKWRQLARVCDLTALCESLTHDELPDDVVVELVELVRATVANRDPQIA